MPVEHDQYLERVPLDDLASFPGNPRRGDVEGIAESLLKRGQYKPLIISLDDVVLVGNHTMKAMQSLGWTTALVLRAPVVASSPEAAQIVLVDNHLPDLGRYDDRALSRLLASLPDIGTSATGYVYDDLDDLLTKLTPPMPSGPRPPGPPPVYDKTVTHRWVCPGCGHECSDDAAI